jgi:hypothetical protein
MFDACDAVHVSQAFYFFDNKGEKLHDAVDETIIIIQFFK